MIKFRYPWPASALTVDDMVLLYHVRKSLSPRVPITRLIAQAVRAMYANITLCAQNPKGQPKKPNA
jgi:hypothetical protein